MNRNAMTQRILIVCRGNICRSPMAEAVMRHHAASLAMKLEVVSAGLAAVAGSPIDPAAERTLTAHGLSARSHLAKQLDRDDIEHADLVLAMEQRHVDALFALSPALRGRTFLLSHWQDGTDIRDPFRRAQDAFENVYDRIESAMRYWMKKL